MTMTTDLASGLGWVDIALLAVLALSVLVGLWRGFVFEIVSLLGWVAAFVFANLCAPFVSDLLPWEQGGAAVRFWLAYALVFVLGIAIAYVGNAAWVFRARMRWATLLPYAGIYLATYFMNAGLIHVLMTQAGVGPRVALAIALVIVTPLSFLLNHAVLGRDARPHA